MMHALEFVERLGRDIRVGFDSVPRSPNRGLDGLLGPRENWDLDEESMSEHTYLQAALREAGEQLRDEEGNLHLSASSAWAALKSLDRVRAQLLPVPVFPDPPHSYRQAGPADLADESWFFINGIAADVGLLRQNGRMLARVFGRSLELIHNPTLGPLTDLLASLTARSLDSGTGPAAYALERVSQAVADPDKQRVVLLAHSQGGTVAAKVVHGIIERFGGDATSMRKLEVYTFGSTSDDFPIDTELSTPERLVPFIEHFANAEDWVAGLGVMSRQREIPGRVFTSVRSGHLLNAHYLPLIQAKEGFAWKGEDDRDWRRDARLFGYREGGIPSPLPIGD